MNEYEIRADYDNKSIVVYQAYSNAIALPALQRNRFVAPFSLKRMTWIKPSFLWLMERSHWDLKSSQEMILAIRITRQGWEEALAQAVLTSYNPHVYRHYDAWPAQFEKALGYCTRSRWVSTRYSLLDPGAFFDIAYVALMCNLGNQKSQGN